MKKRRMVRSKVEIYDMQPKLRSRRKKKKYNAGKIIAAMVFVWLVVSAGFILNTETFKVNAIEIQGNQRVTDQEIYEDADVKIGQNMILLGTRGIRDEIMKRHLILKAEVHRSFPSKLRIVVRERKAFALVTDGARNYLVDNDRVVLETPKRKISEKVFRVYSENVVRAEVGDRLEFPHSKVFRRFCDALARNRDDFDHASFARAGIKMYLRDGKYVLMGEGADIERKMGLVPILVEKLNEKNQDFVGLNLKSLQMPTFIKKAVPAPPMAKAAM